MKNSTKVWGLIGAAAMFAPVGLSAPALADGGKDGKQVSTAASRSDLSSIMSGAAMNHDGTTLARLLAWHEVMLDANKLDHTNDSGFAGDQQGPVRNSRAFAIIQISVFDAVNSFNKKFAPFNPRNIAAPAGASKDAAIAQAAFTALSEMYPRQAARLQELFDTDLAAIQASAASIAAGREVGLRAATATLKDRQSDGAGPAGTSAVVPFGAGGKVASGNKNIFGEKINDGETAAPRWRPDPFPFQDGVVEGVRNVALGANWGAVKPFALKKGDQFRIPAYPAPNSPRFRAAYQDVLFVGSDPDTFPGSTNGANEQFIGNFWGYDGAPNLGTPPRLYAQIAVVYANQLGLTDVDEYARLLALVHTTMGDSGIAAWDSKYFHNYWRPATGIPDGDLDGDATTIGFPSWRPFGASVINEEVPERFTPPFPAYPSGHATFGAATMQSLTSVFGDSEPFVFVSDEYNGGGVDPRLDPAQFPGQVRPLVPVLFGSLLEAQQENGRSRVFNGVHWEPDDTEGQNIGTSIVRFTLTQKFQRR